MNKNRVLTIGLAAISGLASLSFGFAGLASASSVNRTPDLIYTLQGNNARDYPTGSMTAPSNGINGDLSSAWNSASTWGEGCSAYGDGFDPDDVVTLNTSGRLIIKYSTYFFVWDTAVPGDYGTGSNNWGGGPGTWTDGMSISHVILCPSPPCPTATITVTTDPITTTASPVTVTAPARTVTADPVTVTAPATTRTAEPVTVTAPPGAAARALLGTFASPCSTVTVTVTPTITIVPTITLTPTVTVTPTLTNTPTTWVTPTITVTPTESVTVTDTATATLPTTGGSTSAAGSDTAVPLPSTGGNPLPHTGANGVNALLSLGLGLLSVGLLAYGTARRVRTH